MGMADSGQNIIIESLLREGSRKMKFETVLAILAVEFQQQNCDIGGARQALENFPEELADAIEKASETLKKRRGDPAAARKVSVITVPKQYHNP